LPAELQVGRFMESRSAELALLCGELERAGSGKLASQQVPRHMRRRAVSHNPRRLPRRLRPAHSSQREKSGGEGAGGRRPCRRWRRRPGRLLAEYCRRQQAGTRWLETHIWHAKRFHMERVWGLALPRTTTDKTWRACQRATRAGVALWDRSYLSLLQVEGELSTVLAALNQLTEPRTGRQFCYGPGEREAALYAPGCYPAGALGETSYYWRPESADNSFALVWLWCHPALAPRLLDLLTQLTGLVEVEVEEAVIDKDESCSAEVDLVNQAKLAGRLCERKLEGGGLTVTRLDSLNRFSLVGPRSLDLLARCLQLDPALLEAATPGSVLASEAQDPRLTLPARRQLLEAKLVRAGGAAPAWAQQAGRLWCSTTRRSIAIHRKSDRQINQERGGPGGSVGPACLVPVMVVVGEAGADLVLPPGWAMAAWLCLVQCGARAAGLLEWEQWQLERGGGRTIARWEDTAWARQLAERSAAAARTRYASLPPDKRVNRAVLGFGSTFSRDWDVLGREWGEVGAVWWVVRDPALLPPASTAPPGGLVLVRLQLMGRGTIVENSVICLPEPGDGAAGLVEPQHPDPEHQQRRQARLQHQTRLKRLKRQWKKVKVKTVEEMAASVAEDRNQDQTRLSAARTSLAALKTLREEEKARYQAEVERRDGPSGPVREAGARQAMGWVVTGKYCYSAGTPVGEGLVCLAACRLWHHQQTSFQVLVREPTSAQYRVASMQMLVA